MEVPIDFLRECFDYNSESGCLRWKNRPLRHFKSEASYAAWNSIHAGNQAGALHNKGYLMVQIHYAGKKTGLLVHRVAMALTFGYWPELVDHKNGAKTDNRIKNLREASHTQNAWNTHRKHGKYQVGVLGPEKRCSRYVARIKVNGKFVRLGSFSTEREAADAYATAREKLHQEFSVARR